ncbi:16S rRNA (guanine(966)-N(2))-methyltransferase RsmD [Longimonas halophila]|uniref:16S rRNA (Guanine(966)-N(2))-methyltransferase RsmD n=1 Tax=Longimonas halophila TaxID=1469170 RepID=A0A2H3NUQ4_9BACT|nr:RsmD family RNA methyltransferase [Longimonas halophila]PEN08307.1 16S rRNA (guanine(966)-N(2))-methyltransferase RsmD [Longimonas halophila]
MRIIAGQFRGHTIDAPDGHRTRPSTARTRESLFSLIDSRIYLQGAEVIDLFAGTGALGLEAISRGAALVTFVESDGHVLNCARQNAERLGVSDQCLFVQGDAVTYLDRYTGPDVDLIMADPPYKLEAMREMPDLAVPHLNTDGVFTLEHSSHHFFDDHPHRTMHRAYGRTIVTVFRPPLPPADTDAVDAEAASADPESAADA